MAKQGEYKGAIRDYDRVIEIDPNFADAYYNRGVVKVRLKEFQEAIKDFDEAIDLDPKYLYSYVNRGIANAKLGEHKEAVKDFDKAVALKPDDAEFYFNRGESNKELGNTKQSAEDFTKAEKLRRKTMANMPSEKLRDIKNRLKNSCCAICESDELEMEMPEDQIRSIIPSYGGDAFSGLIIVCKKCENSSYYDLERDCFGAAVTSSF